MSIPPGAKFYYSYEPVSSPFELLNTGNTYAFDLASLGCGGVSFDDAWYDLVSINVHAQSEHTFAGQHKPLELHMVHKRSDGDALLLIAVPIDVLNAKNGDALTESSSQMALLDKGKEPIVTDSSQGQNFNPTLQAFLKAAFPPVGMKVTVPGDEVSPLDLAPFLRGGTFFEYSGSLTAPPCAEMATWLVRKEPILAAEAQVRYLEEAALYLTRGYGNYRQTMPLNGRVISVRKALQDANKIIAAFSPESGEVAMPVGGPNPVIQGREERAMNWAKDALKIARETAEYVRDLDRRLHGAAEAHAMALAPPPLQRAPPIATAVLAAGRLAVAGRTPLQPGEPVGAVDMTNTSGASAGNMTLSDAEKSAQKIIASIREAAKEAVAEAVKQISIETHAVALQAARDAARMVLQENEFGRSPASPGN